MFWKNISPSFSGSNCKASMNQHKQMLSRFLLAMYFLLRLLILTLKMQVLYPSETLVNLC
jgi:hypothetical protein